MPRVSSVKITNTTIKSAKPKNHRYEIRDASISGFMLRVAPTGRKLFYVQLERGKKRKVGDASIMTLRRARTIALDMLQRHDAGERVESRLDKNPTLKEYAEGEYSDWVNQNLKDGKASTKRIIRACEPLLTTSLNKLTEIQIERWKAKRLKNGLSTETVKRDLAQLKAALSRAVKWGFISENPAHNVKVKVEKNYRVRYLTDTERDRLIGALEVRDKKRREGRKSGNVFRLQRGYEQKPKLNKYTDYLSPLVRLAMNTGLRRSELFSLTWENVRLKGTPQLAVLAAHAKSGRTRHIPLNKTAVDVLQTWGGQNSQSGLVFPKSDGTPLKSIKTAWGKLIKDAKITDFRFHDLRHDFASRLVMNGVDLYRVKELLGHGSIEITQRYAHLAPHTLAEAVEVLL